MMMRRGRVIDLRALGQEVFDERAQVGNIATERGHRCFAILALLQDF